MNLVDVKNIELQNLKDNYDICILASGYESRSIAFVQYCYENELINKVDHFCVYRLEDNNNNSEYIKSVVNEDKLSSFSSDIDLYQFLSKFLDKDELVILMDYTSMSRMYYSALLNWINNVIGPVKIKVDFVYALGDYNELKENKHKYIESIDVINGFDGKLDTTRETVAVFGLGFDRYAPLCVDDQIEPDNIICYYAEPGANNGSAEKARNVNKIILESTKNKATLPYGISDVEGLYCGLSQNLMPFAMDHNVLLIPMGPKPHVLASLLICTAYPNMLCMRVKGKGSREFIGDVVPNGSYVITEVTYFN